MPRLKIRRTAMKKLLLAAAAAGMALAAILTGTSAGQNGTGIRAVIPEQVPWFTPSYYTDGRQRARLFGDSSRDGAWIDRVKVPAGARVLAHTHPTDEIVTVIEGAWYAGE